MNMMERKLTVRPDTDITSIWAIPENYDNRCAVLLAHGAGSDMHHPFIGFVHENLAKCGNLTVKFNFPYKEKGRKAPDRMPLLLDTWKTVIDAVRSDSILSPRHLLLAGKSMGGRAASLLVAEGESCDGLIFLGYPLHPPGKPDKLRADHFQRISRPMLFIQGTRDRLCDLSLLRQVIGKLSVEVTLHEIEGGDHSFKVLKRLGRSEQEVWEEIAATCCAWIKRRL